MICPALQTNDDLPGLQTGGTKKERKMALAT